MQISSKIRRLLAKNITGFNARCCWPLINHKAEKKKKTGSNIPLRIHVGQKNN
jgi:hypothetical protein